LLVGLLRQGLKVPRDICLTGYDELISPYIQANLHLDDNPFPWRFPITTVRQPMTAIGHKAAEVLIDQVDRGEAETGKEHLLDVQLIVGESSVPPNPVKSGGSRNR
jgi:DNA-binding LacI/PurR family transcriptional regulator